MVLDGNASVDGSGSAETSLGLLLLHPQTGRYHQIRVHASRNGTPILGDGRYGGPRRLTLSDGRVLPLGRVMLHALGATFPLPDGRFWAIQSPVAKDLIDTWTAVGGCPEIWETVATGAFPLVPGG